MEDFDDPGTGTDSPLPGGFRAAVGRELAALGFTVTKWYDDGLDCTRPGEGDDAKRYVGLSNLYRKAKAADRADWPALIKDFLHVVMLTAEGGAPIPDDLAAAADRLLVRLGKPFATDKAPWSKRLPGTDLVLNLVIDAEKFMTYVTPDLMAKSDRPPGEWLDVALENLRRSTPDDWLADLGDDTGVLYGHCNDSYDAARAVILSEIRDPGPGGWLVAVPARDWLFAMPVTVDNAPRFHLLKVLAEKNHGKEPYPISDEVFWVRGRKWEAFKIELTEESVNVYPSEEFLTALGVTGGEGATDEDGAADEEKAADEEPKN
jgi:hypothetical protein